MHFAGMRVRQTLAKDEPCCPLIAHLMVGEGLPRHGGVPAALQGRAQGSAA